MRARRFFIFFLPFSLLMLLLFRYADSPQSPPPTEIKEKLKGNHLEALNALQFLSASASFPGKDIPKDGYAKAYEAYRYNYVANKKESFPGTWKSIGPNNVGGRTIGIAINPNDTNIVWLGSASGGLWKSTTGGTGANAWTYVPTGFPVLGVSCIVINPANTNIMYIGTGETYAYGTSTNGLTDRTTRGTFGIGILKSTDGGVTWAKSLDWSYQQNRGVWEIIFNPKNPDILYAATTEGIYRSNNAGSTWFQVLNVSMAMDIAIDKVDTNILYAGVGNLASTNKGLYKTTNSGTSWNILTNGLPSNTHTGRIIISPYEKNNKILMAMVWNAFSTVGIYRSTNAGATWTSVVGSTEIASWQGWYCKGLLMKPDDSSQVLAASVQIFKSTTSGNNFVEASVWHPSLGPDYMYVHADIHDIVANPKDPNKIYIISDGGLFRSDDFGDTYEECSSGYVTSQFYIGSVSPYDTLNMLGGLQDNNTQQYSFQNNWNPVVGGDGCYNAIDPGDHLVQYAALQNLYIVKTDDGWNFSIYPILETTSSPSDKNAAAFLAPFILCPSDPQIIYAAGDSVIKSLDGGMTWDVAGPYRLDHGNYVLSLAVSATSSDTLYCATAPSVNHPMRVFRSVNGGSTYTDISSGLPNRYPRRITVNPRNSKELYVVFSGFGSGHVFKSTNAGASWSDVSAALPDLPFHCLAIDPGHTNTLYAGCDLGIFVSEDGGSTWASYNEGLAEAVMVFDLVISPYNESLLAFTHGHGVYTRPLVNGDIGIDEKNNSQRFAVNVFPNPAKEILNVNIENGQAIESIVVYDAKGRILFQQQHSSSDATPKQLDVSEYAPGTYLLSVKAGGEICAKRFVVLR